MPDWDGIRAVADAHGLRVVEDSCDVLGARLHGRPTGERADLSATSFARGHAITAAGGRCSRSRPSAWPRPASLPTHHALQDDDVDHILDCLADVFG